MICAICNTSTKLLFTCSKCERQTCIKCNRGMDYINNEYCCIECSKSQICIHWGECVKCNYQFKVDDIELLRDENRKMCNRCHLRSKFINSLN